MIGQIGKASLVVATHNEGENLCSTVESLLSAVKNISCEIIVVDDGSSDGSTGFLEERRYSGEEVVVRRIDHSKGCGYARHVGARLASGEVVFFPDAHVSVQSGWVDRMCESLLRYGKRAIVTPEIVALDPISWGPASGPQGVSAYFNNSLEFEWRAPKLISNMVPLVPGCCMGMYLDFYREIGGFELSLKRWGMEFFDWCLKAYRNGGACYFEPDVVVSHLFKEHFSYDFSCAELIFNKLLVCYRHFPEESFFWFQRKIQGEPGYQEGLEMFEEGLKKDEIRKLPAGMCRDDRWYLRTFFPESL